MTLKKKKKDWRINFAGEREKQRDRERKTRELDVT